MPTTAEAAKMIRERYPDLANVFSGIPDIWNILLWSVSGANMSRTQIDAAIQQTNWYRTHNEKQQAWHVLAATNPAEAVKQQKQAQNDVLQISVRMGANLTLPQIALFSQGALENGWSTAELQDQIIAYTSKLPAAKRGAGEFGAAITKVRTIADEYGMPVSDKQAQNYAANLLQTGSKGDTPAAQEESLRDVFARQAASLFPSLRDELAAGVTVKQWAEPYRQIAAQELGVSPDTMTFNDPKWKRMLEGKQTKKGKVPMSLSEWQTTVRTDQAYGFDKTAGGKLVAAGLADEIATMFGAQG